MPGTPDKLLAGLAVAAWAIAGGPRLAEIAQAGSLSAIDVAWIAVHLGFAVCLAMALGARSPGRALRWTIAQSVLAVAILPLGMTHFEGALLAIVGAQTRLVAPPRVAWVWIAAQAIPLFAAILPSHELLGATKATLEYLGFAAFAMTLFELRSTERERRLDLARIHAELLGTRALLGETVRYAEQSRIRRELHDGLGHHLTALSMQLDRAREDRSGDALGRARAALDALRAESREVLASLGGTIDLEAALSALVGSTPAMRVRLDTAALRDVGPDAAWAIFRCVQEALTNAWKHGRAREVTVVGEAHDDGWRVRIENDGARPRGEIEPGQGLRGMRERLESIGARLVIESGARAIEPSALAPRFAVIASIPRRRELAR